MIQIQLIALLTLPAAGPPTEGLQARRVGSGTPPDGLELGNTEIAGLPTGDVLTFSSYADVVVKSRVLLDLIDGGCARTEIGLTQAANSQQAAERILFVPAYTDSGGTFHEAVVTWYDGPGTGNQRSMSVDMFRLLVEPGGGLDAIAGTA